MFDLRNVVFENRKGKGKSLPSTILLSRILLLFLPSPFSWSYLHFSHRASSALVLPTCSVTATVSLFTSRCCPHEFCTSLLPASFLPPAATLPPPHFLSLLTFWKCSVTPKVAVKIVTWCHEIIFLVSYDDSVSANTASHKPYPTIPSESGWTLLGGPYNYRYIQRWIYRYTDIFQYSILINSVFCTLVWRLLSLCCLINKSCFWSKCHISKSLVAALWTGSYPCGHYNWNQNLLKYFVGSIFKAECMFQCWNLIINSTKDVAYVAQ